MYIIKSLSLMKGDIYLVHFIEGTINYTKEVIWFAEKGQVKHGRSKVLYDSMIKEVIPLKYRLNPQNITFSLRDFVLYANYAPSKVYVLKSFLDRFELPEQYSDSTFWLNQAIEYRKFLSKNFVPLVDIEPYSSHKYKALQCCFMSYHDLRYYIEKEVAEEIGIIKKLEN